MLTPLLLLTQFAMAGSEIGTEKMLGAGVVTGDPYIGVTGKYWINDKSGIAAFLGTSVVFHTLRGSFESEFMTVGEDWDFGQLPVYWHADVEVGAYFLRNQGVYPRVAAGGGVGTAFQLDMLPVEAYANVGILAGYNGYCGAYGAYSPLRSVFCYVRPTVWAGGRWYF